VSTEERCDAARLFEDAAVGGGNDDRSIPVLESVLYARWVSQPDRVVFDEDSHGFAGLWVYAIDVVDEAQGGVGVNDGSPGAGGNAVSPWCLLILLVGLAMNPNPKETVCIVVFVVHA
jgi:hypothetical protein